MSEELVNKLTSVEQEQASIQSRTSALNDRLNEFESNSHSKKKMSEHKEAKVKAEAKVATVEGKGVTEMKPRPEFIDTRLAIWNELMEKHKQQLAAKPTKPIKVTLPDGKVMDGESWRTTPLNIAEQISKGLADNTVIAKVNDELWDLERPLEDSCQLKLLKFDDEEGKYVFWHSTAHLMGEAMELAYGGCLCYGPPIENGFYYDMYLENRQVSSNDFSELEKIMKRGTNEKQPFERLEISKEDLLRLFGYNQFKVRILNEKVNTPTTTVYRCGPLIDLCRGPHVRHTGKIKAFKLTKNSSSYWEGDSNKESLQRIYGISFPDSKQLKEWEHFQEEAAKRNHRKIGTEQELFFFHELSPGSCFFYPKGAIIYNKLIDFIRSEYRKRGFQEVISPNVYNAKLWMTSGHWQHYSENMFQFEVEKEKFALKPMNCPGHCVMFASRNRSWRELPLRYADFGVLHRNELSGTLTGLTRVRRFQQDDAHIFCMSSQIKSEIRNALDFLKSVYEIFGFTFDLKLSTRPENFLGEIETWNKAEKQLEEALNEFGKKWTINPGDGAFYGPKIDITIQDALRRSHQCATIQLDFQLPERFNLTYVSADESGAKERPVIIHRAILGSVERMIAILTESFGGKWPFWISPRQSIVLTISDKLDSYAHKVREEIYAAGFECDFNSDAGTTLNKKVRNAQLDNYNFILVIGEKEQQQNTVNVRTRDNKVHGEVAVDEVIRRFREMAASKTNHSEEEFGSSSSNVSVPTASLADVKLTEKEASEPLDSSKYC